MSEFKSYIISWRKGKTTGKVRVSALNRFSAVNWFDTYHPEKELIKVRIPGQPPHLIVRNCRYCGKPVLGMNGYNDTTAWSMGNVMHSTCDFKNKTYEKKLKSGQLVEAMVSLKAGIWSPWTVRGHIAKIQYPKIHIKINHMDGRVVRADPSSVKLLKPAEAKQLIIQF